MSLRQWKKSYSGFLLAALILPILAACGGNAPATSSSAASTAASAAPAEPASAVASAAPAEPASAVASAAPAESASAVASAAPAESASGEASSAAGGKVLRVHQPSYPDIFDPQVSSFSSEILILSMNYEGLTKLDKDLKAVPAAAESWEFNDVGDVITFTLRADLKYSDGSPLTADRFAYAVERTCDPATAGQYSSILYDIQGCQDLFENTLVTDTAAYDAAKQVVRDAAKAVDERTLVLKLNGPAPYFPYIAGTWVFYPAKKELIEQGGADWWKNAETQIGNGPFQVTDIAQEQQITFKANENYWEGRPKLDGVELVYIKDTTVALQAYRSGQLDTVQLSQAPDQIPAVQSDPALSQEYLSYAGANTFAMGFNLTKAPFDDKAVREAFAYAFDAKTYCETIRNGDCVPANSWIPQGIAGSIKTDAYSFDPQKAKDALARSKYANNMPEIKLTYASSDPSNQARAEFYAQQIQEVLGIQMTLDPVETTALSALRKNPETYPQACFTCQNWYQDYPDPQNWLSVYWKSNGFAQRVSYKNEQLDELLNQADRELDPAKRTKLYEQASQILIDDLPSPFMYHRANVFLVKPEVTGYTPTAADSELPGQWGSLLTLDLNR